MVMIHAGACDLPQERRRQYHLALGAVRRHVGHCLLVTPNGGNIVVTWNASGIFTLSDKRAKENLELVGDLAGKLGVYSYNYKGSEKREVGLLAQEVEQVVPDAVICAGAFKAVSFGRVIEALA